MALAWPDISSCMADRFAALGFTLKVLLQTCALVRASDSWMSIRQSLPSRRKLPSTK
jgi:hypothetical protein